MKLEKKQWTMKGCIAMGYCITTTQSSPGWWCPRFWALHFFGIGTLWSFLSRAHEQSSLLAAKAAQISTYLRDPGSMMFIIVYVVYVYAWNIFGGRNDTAGNELGFTLSCLRAAFAGTTQYSPKYMENERFPSCFQIQLFQGDTDAVTPQNCVKIDSDSLQFKGSRLAAIESLYCVSCVATRNFQVLHKVCSQHYLLDRSFFLKTLSSNGPQTSQLHKWCADCVSCQTELAFSPGIAAEYQFHGAHCQDAVEIACSPTFKWIMSYFAM